MLGLLRSIVELLLGALRLACIRYCSVEALFCFVEARVREWLILVAVTYGAPVISSEKDVCIQALVLINASLRLLAFIRSSD